MDFIESDKKKKIAEAFLSEITEYGYQNSNTVRICQRAGVSKGLLFHYYKSKENMFTQIASDCLNNLTEIIGGFEDGDRCLLETLRRFNENLESYLTEHPCYYKIYSIVLFDLPKEFDPILRPKIDLLRIVTANKLGKCIERDRLRSEVRISEAVDIMFAILSFVGDRYKGKLLNTGFSREQMREIGDVTYKYFNCLFKGILITE